MRFRFQEIDHLKEPLPVSQDLDVSSLLNTNHDVLNSTPLHIHLTVRQEAGMAVAEGELGADVSFTCSRCLEPFTESFRIPFRESFYQTDNEPEEDADHVHPTKDEHFNLLPWIEEAFVVELPFIPVCNSGCEGLCPECGTNRNINRCNCQNKRVDPRLMGLADWLERSSEDQI